MEPIDEPGQRRFVSMPNLIAWLSLCILAAARGRSLDDHWQPIWATMGAYGLVAAVGLGVLERARFARQARLHEKSVQARVEHGLTRLCEHDATIESINAGISRLTAAAVQQFGQPTFHTGILKRRAQARLLSRLPLEIVAVLERDEVNHHLARPIAAKLEDISARTLSFFHLQPFLATVALLNFDLGGDSRISFVVDVMWSEKSGSGFASGGTVLAVGVPADNDVVAEQLEPVAC
jgi:hypothetical protein